MSVILPIVAAALAIGGILLCFSPSNSKSHKRIEARVAAVSREDLVADPEKGALSGLQWAARFSVMKAPTRALLQANWSVDVRVLLGMVAALVALVAAMAMVWGTVAAGACGVLALVTVYKIVDIKGRRNVRRFNAHLPAFIERLRMILTSGNSLVSAFDKALGHSDFIVQAYLRPVAVRLSHGVNLAEALRAQGNRLGVSELAMLAMVAHANIRFGGSLSDILDRLSDTVRGRNQAQREFEAATAEVRSSSKVLFVLPLLVVAAIFAFKPDYFTFFAEDRMGHMLLGYAVGSVIVGALVLNRLQTIRY